MADDIVSKKIVVKQVERATTLVSRRVAFVEGPADHWQRWKGCVQLSWRDFSDQEVGSIHVKAVDFNDFFPGVCITEVVYNDYRHLVESEGCVDPDFLAKNWPDNLILEAGATLNMHFRSQCKCLAIVTFAVERTRTCREKSM